MVKKVEDLIDFFSEAKWLANFPGIIKMVEKAKEAEEEKTNRPEKPIKIRHYRWED